MNNVLREFTTVQECAESLDNSEIGEIIEKALRHCKGKRVSHYTEGLIQGMPMITLIIRGEKASNRLSTGYHLCYAHNLEVPDFSELGDCFIEKTDIGFRRLG